MPVDGDSRRHCGGGAGVVGWGRLRLPGAVGSPSPTHDDGAISIVTMVVLHQARRLLEEDDLLLHRVGRLHQELRCQIAP